MAFTKLDTDLNIIQALDDEPNDVGGLSAAELKAKFDEAGNTIKTYLNDTLLSELENAGAENVGIDTIPELPDVADVQAALTAILAVAQDAQAGTLAPGIIDTEKLANLAVTTGKIADLAVTTGKLSNNAITTAKIVDLAVTAAKIAAGAITSDKLSANAVQTAAIADRAIINAKLGDQSVTVGKIADGSVTSTKLASGAATADKIANGAVTEDKIGNAAVTASKIADNTVSFRREATISTSWTPTAAPFIQSAAASGIVPEDDDHTITWSCTSSDPDVLAAYDLIDKVADTDVINLTTDSVISVNVPIRAVQNSHVYDITAAATGWTPTGLPVVQTIAVSDITGDDHPIIDVMPSADMDTADSQLAAWSAVYKMVTDENAITVYATEETETAIPIQVLCIRK